MKSRLVVGGAFSLHLLHCVLEDLFVAHVSLDEMFEAGNHCLGLLVKLKHSRRRSLGLNMYETEIKEKSTAKPRQTDMKQWIISDEESVRCSRYEPWPR